MTKTSATSRDLAETYGVAVAHAVEAVNKQPQAADLAAEPTQQSSKALPKSSLTKQGKPRKNAAKPKPEKKGLKGLQPEFIKLAYYSANAIKHGTEYQYTDALGQVL